MPLHPSLASLLDVGSAVHVTTSNGEGPFTGVIEGALHDAAGRPVLLALRLPHGDLVGVNWLHAVTIAPDVEPVHPGLRTG